MALDQPCRAAVLCGPAIHSRRLLPGRADRPGQPLWGVSLYRIAEDVGRAADRAHSGQRGVFLAAVLGPLGQESVLGAGDRRARCRARNDRRPARQAARHGRREDARRRGRRPRFAPPRARPADSRRMAGPSWCGTRCLRQDGAQKTVSSHCGCAGKGRPPLHCARSL